MQLWRDRAVRLWGDDRGQGTVEYVVLLAIITTMLVMVIKKMIQPLFARLVSTLSNNIEKKFFGSNLHTFRVKR